MDINDLRGIATIFTTVAFLAVVVWAYSGKRKSQFDDAANAPFADEGGVDAENGETRS
jgi:cytochrome c oxidase cbb3-type subunit 4